MLASFFLTLVLIGAAFAAVPRRCCFDKQYSATMTAVGEVIVDNPESASFIDGYFRVNYDYYVDRQAVNSFMKIQDGSISHRYELRDYASRKVYTQIDNGTCTYTNLPPFEVMRPSCIPENATLIGESTFGYGAHSIKLNNWFFSFAISGNQTTKMSFSVTADHCVPVMETVVGEFEGNPIEETVFFIQYQPGLDGKVSLDIPTGCMETSTPPSWF